MRGKYPLKYYLSGREENSMAESHCERGHRFLKKCLLELFLYSCLVYFDIYFLKKLLILMISGISAN